MKAVTPFPTVLSTTFKPKEGKGNAQAMFFFLNTLFYFVNISLKLKPEWVVVSVFCYRNIYLICLTLTVHGQMMRMPHLFGLVAAPHVFSNVLDALDGLFNLRWHHRKGHDCVDALVTQLTCHLPGVWGFWGFLPMLARAGAFLSSAALHSWELAFTKLQTVKRSSSKLLGIIIN